MVRFEGLTFAYGGRRSGRHDDVVRDLSVEIAPGEIVGVAGRSGSGKSTILKLAAGLIQPTGGSAVVENDGQGLGAWYAAQTPVLIDFRTVLENVVLPREVFCGSDAQDSNQAADICDQLGLLIYVGGLPAELSGGMKRRVALAQSLYSLHRTLLLDEPFAELDMLTRQAAEDALWDQVRGSQRTVLFASHDLDSIAAVADRAIVISGPPRFSVAEIGLKDRFSSELTPRGRRESRAFRAATLALQEALIDLEGRMP